MHESIKNLLNNRNAFISFLKASKSKQVKEIAKQMDISLKVLEEYLDYYDLWEYVVKVCSPEKELAKYLPNFHKNRKIISPYEIDFYNDKFKLGVEFNGTYWHSSYHKDYCYHQEKSLIALMKGIKIYHIFEYEWNDRGKIFIMNDLQKIVHQLPKIYDCEIKEISNKVAEEFLYYNSYEHENYEVAYGLFKDDLKAVITLKGKVITNYVEKLGIELPNGLKSFMQKDMIYYSNLAKPFDYGLKSLGKTDPETIWFKSSEKLSKEKKEYLLAGCNESEDTYLKKLGYKQLYDCGRLKLVMG